MIDVLLIAFGITLLPACTSSRLQFLIRLLVVQGLILFWIAIGSLEVQNWLNLLVALLETLLLKAIVMPWWLHKTIRHNQMRRDIEPYVSYLFSLLAGTFLLIGGFFFAHWIHAQAAYVKPLHFGLAFSTMGVGFFIMLTRKKLITHLIGYMIMENGIFLLSLAMIVELPMLVNMGVLLDIFLVLLISGLFINRIHSSFEEEHLSVESLTALKH